MVWNGAGGSNGKIGAIAGGKTGGNSVDEAVWREDAPLLSASRDSILSEADA